MSRRRSVSPVRCGGSTGCCSWHSWGCPATGCGRSTGSRRATRAGRRSRGRGCTPSSVRSRSWSCCSSIPTRTAACAARSTSARSVLLGVVLATGAATRGSKRWINVGFFQFQPSEFAKVLFVLVVAGFLVDRASRHRLGAHRAGDARLRTRADRARVRAARLRNRARLRRRARWRSCSSQASAGHISPCWPP